ncbi:hypothetical protein [Bradyrhizobium canariense]|uniref:hypothetical protein n=1 Tax=Bradyrhizobium canariense TaxID=255045 RepID=UPI001B8A37E0|nr:hypothetical protein [Bradyrhizobium canariense]MBR0950330.1 hypothetical protein [Bradyrhizobium canariense]
MQFSLDQIFSSFKLRTFVRPTAASHLAQFIPSATSWLDKRGAALYSTRRSVRSLKPSLLACIELSFAVGLYWWIAIHFDTQKHLWVSICIAPLLLLRSQESVALGVRLFRRYTELYNPHLREERANRAN